MGTYEDGCIDVEERAFARPFSMCGGSGFSAQRGMSLREYYAGQALMGGFNEFLTSSAWDNYDDFADSCYAMAEAMMRRREFTAAPPKPAAKASKRKRSK